MINQLLRKNVSQAQVLAYTLAALMGMTILFAGFRLWFDIKPLFASKSSLFNQHYLIVNKKVNLLSVFSSSNSNSFTVEQLNEIKAQDFVKSSANFTSSQYQVQAFAQIGGQGFSTELFFESLPDKYIQSTKKAWKWDSTSKEIPIILPRDYLNLYNFGFATSRGLPQMSESLISKVRFNIRLQGQGQIYYFEGRIVDFSNHLNTILVPYSFMQWSNNLLADQTSQAPISRLIIEANSPTDPAIAEFFSKQNYELNTNQEQQSKQIYLLKYLIVFVMGIGLLVLLPAIAYLLICINLLLYKNEDSLSKLLSLGYKRQQLIHPYAKMVFVLNSVVGLLALALAYFIQTLYQNHLIGILDQPAKYAGFITGVFALGFILIISLVDILWIRRKIGQIHPPVC